MASTYKNWPQNPRISSESDTHWHQNWNISPRLSQELTFLWRKNVQKIELEKTFDVCQRYSRVWNEKFVKPENCFSCHSINLSMQPLIGSACVFWLSTMAVSLLILVPGWSSERGVTCAWSWFYWLLLIFSERDNKFHWNSLQNTIICTYNNYEIQVFPWRSNTKNTYI